MTKKRLSECEAVQGRLCEIMDAELEGATLVDLRTNTELWWQGPFVEGAIAGDTGSAGAMLDALRARGWDFSDVITEPFEFSEGETTTFDVTGWPAVESR